jgi:4-alpha-glucanotransferase
VAADEFEAFRAGNAYWLEDWERFAGPGAAADQVRFDREWTRLRAYAAARGVRLIGDVPIYVARESADVHAHPELFDTDGRAGAPPDLANPGGQLWGNPLHRWPAHRAEGYRWWIERFRRTFALHDRSRIDHFRGFVSYWYVPPGATEAAAGKWRRGPGAELFRAVERELGGLPLIVEDLGVITPAVNRLRDQLGLPGTRVLQRAFRTAARNPHALANQPENAVVYIGTHDHDPAAAWWEAAPVEVRRRAADALAASGIEEAEPAWALIRLAFSSRARVAILQAQDVLGLGPEARLNTPGTVTGNWRWRLEPGQLTAALAGRLREATAAAGRLALR